MSVAAQSGGGAGSFMPILMIVLLFVVMYFMMIRPQQKRRREAEQMQASLEPGAEVVTIGGLHGTVVAVGDDIVTLEVAPGVHTRYARPAIARVSARAEVEEAEELESDEEFDANEADETEGKTDDTKVKADGAQLKD